MIITECGETDFGTVYFDSNCIANILSFGNIVSVSESVSYDSYQDCYKAKMIKSGPVYRFVHDQSTNIYLCDLDRNVSYKNVSFDKSIMVMTVKDKKKLYTARQVKSAELAREYQRKLGYTSPGQLIKLIGQGKLDKSDITAQDVVRALDIFGPDLGSLKGKTTSMARDGKGRGGRLEVVVSYGYKLEARVNFYVEAVSGYDDTTDCSVRWVVYRSTIR